MKIEEPQESEMEFDLQPIKAETDSNKDYYKLYFMPQLFTFNPSNFRHGLHLWHTDGKAQK